MTGPSVGDSEEDIFLLTRQQRAVHDVLTVRGSNYSQMYIGAVMVLGNARNPDRHALAAHGLREVADLLQRDFGAPVRTHGESMGSKANELEDAYARAESSVKQATQSNSPVAVDHPLRLLLQRLVQFVEWNREFAPRRRIRAGRAVRTMAVPGALPTPQHTEKHVVELLHCHDRLNKLAHHKATTDADILAEVDRFERLLLTLLGGQSMQLRELDELLKGGTFDAN